MVYRRCSKPARWNRETQARRAKPVACSPPGSVVLLLALAVVLLSPFAVWSQPPSDLDAKKLDAGVFENVWSDEAQEPGPCTPPALRLETRTNTVHASLLTRFGFTYMLSGGPPREHLLEIVIRHPAMVNPATGETLTRQSLEITACPGTRAFAGWSFTSGWELVSGTWTVELHQKGRKLLEHDFEVAIESEYPQMQLDYSLVPEDGDAFDAFLLTQAETTALLEHAGLGAARVVGTFFDAESAQERAGQCRSQGKASYVVDASGMLGTVYLVECVDYTRGRSVENESGDVARGRKLPAKPEAEVAATREPAVDERTGKSHAGNATRSEDQTQSDADAPLSLSGGAGAEGFSLRPGGYALLFALLDSSQVASRYAGALAENVDVALEVHRIPGRKRQWLYGVLGPPQTLDSARATLAVLNVSETPPFVVKLAPLQALARGESGGPGSGQGAGEYDPSLAAMSKEAEAQALEALRRASESMEDKPSIHEVSRMPEDVFGEDGAEGQSPHNWTVQGRAASRFGMQNSPPVSTPEETGVDVLVGRVNRRSEARQLAERLEEIEVQAVVSETGPRAYEVRIKNLADPRAARRLVQQISSRIGVNATVVLAAGAGKADAPEAEAEVEADESGASPYAVQVISTRVRSEAQRYMETLRSKGYVPMLVEVSGKLGAWYAVRIGAYETLEAAEQASDAFSQEEGLSSIVVEDAE